MKKIRQNYYQKNQDKVMTKAKVKKIILELNKQKKVEHY